MYIYPNPANDQFIIDTKGNELSFRLLDSFGKTVLESVVSGKEQFSTKALPNGLYFYQLGEKTGKLSIQK